VSRAAQAVAELAAAGDVALATPEGFVLWIDGQPRPQGSKKVIPGLSFPIEAGKHIGKWRTRMKRAARVANAGRQPLDGPLQLRAVFYFTRPRTHVGVKGLRKAATAAPTSHHLGDLSKLVRALEDAMVDARVIVDDSRITKIDATKLWGDRAGVALAIAPHRDIATHDPTMRVLDLSQLGIEGVR
jgi:Holliday junction resolvase RusA-like endonuclease